MDNELCVVKNREVFNSWIKLFPIDIIFPQLVETIVLENHVVNDAACFKNTVDLPRLVNIVAIF